MMAPDEIARIAHEVNRAYCQSIGDDTQPAWEDAPEWQRASAIDGVRFTQTTPDATPADSHDNWMAQKRADGWGWGPVKDPERKEHPCYLPYDQLAQAQRTKDHLFQAVVRSLSGVA